MSSSHEEIVGAQVHDSYMLWLALICIIVLSLIVIAISLDSPVKSKRIASYGLVLDMIGVFLASYPLVFPLRKKTQPGMQFLSNYAPYRAQEVTEYADKHGLKIQIGIVFIIFGFIMQLLSNWV